MIHPVILAGGKGERFWPYSNYHHPKQLLPLVTEKSMLEDILEHIAHLKSPHPVHIIVSKNLRNPITKLLGKQKNIVLVVEPEGKNTAAAIATACKLIARKDPKGVMAVLTADHSISPSYKFIRALKAADKIASAGNSLVTFGIRPNRPETGYGYIESGKNLGIYNGLECFKVVKFHEKPSITRAKKYVQSKKYFWNSGMFAWRVDYLWKLFEIHLPNTYSAFEAAGPLNPSSPSFRRKLKLIYSSLTSQSIDYGIMENAEEISVVVPDFSWDDIGAWSALERLHEPDKKNNIRIGEVVELDSQNTCCFTDSGLIAVFGVRDLLVVQHGGVTMVVHKNRQAELKSLVARVKEQKKYNKYL